MESLYKINFYELFEINPTSKSNEILNAYKNKINKFRNVHIIEYKQISEIKLLKQGLYILLNKKLRLKYNKTIGLSNKSTKIDNEPMAMNNDIDDSLDSVFNIDNSWMHKHMDKDNDKNKKNNNEPNIIGDRIFSLSNLNKKPGYSTNDEIDLRKPLQGRIDKNI